MKPNVYDYTNPASYLRDALEEKQKRNPSFSARAWAKQMGFKGHTLLSFFLNDQRPIKPQHLAFISRGLDLTENERRYFDALVYFTASDSPAEKSIYEKWLKDLHPSHDVTFVEIERFRTIAEWYHMAILEMTQLKDFKADAEWIARRLGDKVSLKQIEEAIDRLVALGLLQEKKGKLVKTHARLTTPKDRPSQAIRSYHKQNMLLAAEAIESQSVDERDFNSCALTIKKDMIPKAKEIIAKFRAEMAQVLEKHPGDETYNLSIQFFRLTEPTEQNRKIK